MKKSVAILLLLAAPAFAAGPDAGKAGGNHFPQPVRVADLIGRKLIGARESQPLLGHVHAVERRADGLAVRIDTWSLLPGRSRSVSVALDRVAFLGPQLALTGLSEAELDALPDAPPASPIGPDEIIRVDIVKPFH